MLPAVGPSPLNVNPIFEIGPLEPRYSEWLVFEGISVDEKGVQHYLGKHRGGERSQGGVSSFPPF